MPSSGEIARSLAAAWDLFLDRAGAMRRFDLSIEGFWRSFAAVILVAPAYALVALADRQAAMALDPAAVAESGSAFLLHNGLGLLLDWIALPLILAALARTLGIERRYGAFIIARNWCAVITSAAFGAIGLLMLLGIADGAVGSVLTLAVIVAALRYNYIVARRALDATVGFAIGIVVLDFVVSLTLALALDGLFVAQ